MMGNQMEEKESENLEYKNYKIAFMMSHRGIIDDSTSRYLDETYLFLLELGIIVPSYSGLRGQN